MKDKIFLIDGNSLFFRAYYGTLIKGKDVLRNSKNIPVNGVLTFGKMILNLIFDYQPTHIFVAFDTGKKTKRHDQYQDYKKGRIQAPDELIAQFPLMIEMLDALKIKHHAIVGYEADDIIASLAKKYSQTQNVVIISSDRDLCQVVKENVTLIIPQNRHKKPLIINNQNFFTNFSIYPQQVIDYKSLVGDSSDNLLGVKGIGPQGAIKLLKEYQTLEQIYANLDNLPLKIKEKLVSSEENVFLTKKLVKLEENLKTPYQLKDLHYLQNDVFNGLKFFKKYELFSLINKLMSKSI